MRYYIRYLQGMKDCMLTYKRSEQLEVIGYLNLDFAGCHDSRNSTFGYLFLLENGAILCKNARKSIIASSIMEVEFMTCFKATTQGLWLLPSCRKFIVIILQQFSLLRMTNILKVLSTWSLNILLKKYRNKDYQYNTGIK